MTGKGLDDLYERGVLLGKGAFAEVFKGTRRDSAMPGSQLPHEVSC